jgi:hypothetical protein
MPVDFAAALRLAQQTAAFIKLFNTPVDFFHLLRQFFPVFRKIVPLRIQFSEIFALLLDPGKIL